MKQWFIIEGEGTVPPIDPHYIIPDAILPPKNRNGDDLFSGISGVKVIAAKGSAISLDILTENDEVVSCVHGSDSTDKSTREAYGDNSIELTFILPVADLLPRLYRLRITKDSGPEAFAYIHKIHVRRNEECQNAPSVTGFFANPQFQTASSQAASQPQTSYGNRPAAK